MTEGLYYQVEAFPEQHIFKVTLSFTAAEAGKQTFRLPAWIPGSYKIRDFAKNIVSICLTQAGQTRPITKTDKTTWQADVDSGLVTIEYEVYAFDLSVRGSYLDNQRGFFNGSSLFICPDGFEASSCLLDLKRPNAAVAQTWRIGTSLPEKEAARYEFGTYQAANYDDLLDHPIEMSDFSLTTFEACGISHDIIITGRHQADLERLATDLEKICTAQLEFFAKPYPFERYVFLVLVVGDGYGGLEHRASTSLICSRTDLPQSREKDKPVTEHYCNFLELCSHEYFHNWNVKRIKPKVFAPYDLRQETPTPLLWVFEGFTRYYEGIFLVRSGLIPVSLYLQRMAQLFTVQERAPGRYKQTLVDSSFDAWIKLYQADENSINSSISYYTKGGIVALLLDLKLRLATDGRHTLDDVVLTLWQQYLDGTTGITDDAVQQIIHELSGGKLEGFLNQALYGLEDLPLSETLAEFGVQCQKRFLASNADRGGETKTDTESKASLGIRGNVTPAGLVVNTVFTGSAAELAGVAAGDVLLALDGLKFKSEWEQQVANHAIGSCVEVIGFRRDEVLTYTVKLQATAPEGYVLRVDSNVTETVAQRRQSWLCVECS